MAAAPQAQAKAPSTADALSSSFLSSQEAASPTLSKEDQPWPDLYDSPHVTTLSREQLEGLLEGNSTAVSTNGSSASWLLVVYAPWCPHCQALEAALLRTAEALAESEGGRTLVAKFRGDRQERPFVAEKLDVKSFPSIFMLRPDQPLPSGASLAVGSARLIKKVSERRDVDSLLRWAEALQ